MTVVSKQTLLDYFSSGGRATNPTSTGEWEFEDLIDTLFDVEDQVDVLGDIVDGWNPTEGAYEFYPALDEDGNDYLDVYGAALSNGSSTQRGTSWHITNPGYSGTSITIYPYLAIASSSDGNLLYVHRCEYSPVNGSGWVYATTTDGTSPYSTFVVTGSPGAFSLPGMTLENNASGDWMIQSFLRRRSDDAADTVDDTVYLMGFMVYYG